MGLNSSQTTTLSRTAHPLLPGDIISQITGGFTFDALTNPLDSRDAEIIVDRLVSGLNSKHYATIHRAVCASFPEHDNKRKTYNYSEWPLKHPSGCGGLHAPKRDGGPGAPKRSFENNQFCLTWGTPEEEIYVKACKYKYAWLFSWTVSIEKFRWTEQEPKLDTSMARQMVNQEDYRFSLQKKEAYLEAIGVGSLYNNSNHGRFISSATFKDLSEWKQTEEGWTSSAEYVHSDSGHIGFARFLIEKDGELCMHYNLDPDEDITDRPCDWRKDF